MASGDVHGLPQTDEKDAVPQNNGIFMAEQEALDDLERRFQTEIDRHEPKAEASAEEHRLRTGFIDSLRELWEGTVGQREEAFQRTHGRTSASGSIFAVAKRVARGEKKEE